MEKYEEIQRSIIKTYRKEIWAKFVKAVKDYKLINENDKIMVCISGGKDSFLLAKCMQELQVHGDVKFDAYFVVMDPGYSKENRQMITDNAKLLNVPIEIFESNIFASLDVMGVKSPCYLCARMRRGYLYNRAKELGCNKIALGHHFDDVIETTLLSMLYGSEIKTMLPKLHSTNYPGLELIRPMYLIKESSINMWKKHNSLTFINCACKFTERSVNTDSDISKRLEMKKLIEELRKKNKEVDNNIFKSLNNINLDCVLGTKKDGIYKSFLDAHNE